MSCKKAQIFSPWFAYNLLNVIRVSVILSAARLFFSHVCAMIWYFSNECAPDCLHIHLNLYTNILYRFIYNILTNAFFLFLPFSLHSLSMLVREFIFFIKILFYFIFFCFSPIFSSHIPIFFRRFPIVSFFCMPLLAVTVCTWLSLYVPLTMCKYSVFYTNIHIYLYIQFNTMEKNGDIFFRIEMLIVTSNICFRYWFQVSPMLRYISYSRTLYIDSHSIELNRLRAHTRTSDLFHTNRKKNCTISEQVEVEIPFSLWRMYVMYTEFDLGRAYI